MFRLPLAAAAALLLPQIAAAQALVVPDNDEALPRTSREGGSDFAVTRLDITARVANRSADVTVAQTVRNTGQADLQVRFLFPLPAEATVDGMTLLVDGKEFPAELLARKEARRRFEAIVRAKQDPALLEWSGGRLFQTRVFPIPVGAERTVTVHYTRLLTADFGLTELDLPLSAATVSKRPLETLAIRVTLQEDGLRTVYSPTHDVGIEQDGENDSAVVSFEADGIVPGQDFRLMFDTAQGERTAGRLLTYRPDPKQDGTFLFIATPPPARAGDAETQAKATMMVLDRSGSMNGEKIQQAREALRYVLGNLAERDLFNVVTYADTPDPLFGELQRATGQPLAEAKVFAAGVAAGGGTNIHDALATALGQLNVESAEPNYLLFLTDGLPTAGTTDEAAIAQMVAERGGNVRLISFGVGYDVNSRLLDRLSRENRGFSEYVQPTEDIEAAVSRVYRRLSTPVLVDAEIAFDFADQPQATPTNRVIPGGSVDLFAGQEMIVVGRYRHHGEATVRLTGTRGGEEVSETFAATFAEREDDSRLAFVEKLWATRRIGQIINDLDLKTGDDARRDELVKELVDLSTRHGILTQYTAFLADEDNDRSVAAARTESLRRLSSLDRADGAEGFSQRAVKNFYADNDLYAAPTDGNGVFEKSRELQQLAAEPDAGFGYGGAAGGGRFGGYGGGYGPVASPVAAADGAEPERLAERKPLAPVVQAAGNQTLYRRDNQLRTVDTLEIDTEKEQPTEIERFSDEYFRLYAANTADENALLSRQETGQELLVRLRGTLYLIK